MTVTVIDHPLVADRLSRLRDENTPRSEFRTLLGDLSYLLIYEATRSFPRAERSIVTPMGPSMGTRLDAVPLLVPIVRAGLGMLAAGLDLFGDAEVGFVGLRRDEESLLPSIYMNSIPADLGGRPVIVLDPMLATGGSLLHTCALLEGTNLGELIIVCVLAAPEGIAAFTSAYPDASIFTAAVDERLNDKAYIVPGLGDAGDRQFGLP